MQKGNAAGCKAQGGDGGGMVLGSKEVAQGMGHKPRSPAKRRVLRAIETRTRQQGRKACQQEG